MKKFSELGIRQTEARPFIGEKVKISSIVNKDIEVMDIEISESKYKDLKSKCECLKMQINLGGNKRVVFTGATMLVQAAKQVDGSMLPFTTKIIEEDGYYRFT